MLPDELLFGKAEFRNADQAAYEIGRSTNCRMAYEPVERGLFALDVRFVSNGSIFVLDTINGHGSRAYTENGVRCIGIRTVGRGTASVMRGRETMSIAPDQGMIFDTARSNGYGSSADGENRLVLMCFDRANEAARRLIDHPLDDDWPWAQAFDVDSPVGRGLTALVNSTVANIEIAHNAGRAANHSLRLSEEALLMFLIEQAGVFRGAGDPGEAAAPSARQVSRAVELIEAMSDPLTVTEVAEAVGVSVRALQLAFRRRMGASPHTVIKRARLRQARQLLESGEVATVRDAANRLGFSNVARFSSEYREVFGETPLMALKRTLGGAATTDPGDGPA
jgi:AraC-like DNA-binding protein